MGGSKNDASVSVYPALDGGYFVASLSNSTDGDVSGLLGGSDMWVTKIDKNGKLVWQRCLGGTKDESTSAIRATPDSGFIVVGSTFSSDGHVIGQHGGTSDGWACKVDKKGEIEWQRALGGLGGDGISAVDITPGGGYILAGSSNYNSGDVSGVHDKELNPDAWVVKLNDKGELQWQRALGGVGSENASSVRTTPDNGYIVVGSTNSTDGDVSGGHGSSDFWVVKLDVNGKIQWQKALGGSGTDVPYSVATTADKGYVVAGYTESKDGDVKGQHGVGEDGWIVKLDSVGNINWQRALGGQGREFLYSVQSSPTGFIVAGNTASYEGDIKEKERHGSYIIPDIWVVKLDLAGAITWQRVLGGTASDIGRSIANTADGGYIVAGYTSSNDEDVSGNHGLQDGWIVKLAGESAPCMQLAVSGKTKFCASTSTAISVSAIGGTAPFTYQWKQNTTNVGTSSSLLSVTTAATYTVEVTDSKGCKVTSAGFTVSKIDAPTMPIITTSTSAINAGGVAVLQTSVASGLALQWLLNNNPITGATQSTYSASQGGTYTVRATNRDSCSTTSSPFTLNLITAIEEQDLTNEIIVSVSPNPSSGFVEVRFNKESLQPKTINFLLSDLTGQSLIQKQFKLHKLHTEKLDISQRAAGLYLLNIITDTQLIQLKLLKH